MAAQSGSKRRLDPAAMLVFAAIARSRGVRGAATVLGTPRSTVSRKLAELEVQVGAPLVVRTARRFALTELGASVAVECEALERVIDGTEGLVRRRVAEPAGVLRVVVAPVLGEEILPAVIAELLRTHHRLSIEARLGVDYVNLRQAAVDVALRASRLDDATDLYAVRLGTSASGCYASPAYVAAQGLPKTPAELADHACVLVGNRARMAWTFRHGTRDVEIEVGGRVRVDSFRVARDLAARGAGIVRVATVFAEPLVARGELVPVLDAYWTTVPVFAVHAGPNPATPAVRAFIDAARAAVGKALGPDPVPRRRAWRSA